MLPGGVYAQWVRCGHANCKCMKEGKRHGSYYYRFWREGGRLHKYYIRRADVDAVRAACEAYRQAHRESLDARQQWREMLAQIRVMEQNE